MAYLHRFKLEKSPNCPACGNVDEDAEHVFFNCGRFEAQRSELIEKLGATPTPETIVNIMLSDEDNWRHVQQYATKLLVELRHEEKSRRGQDIP